LHSILATLEQCRAGLIDDAHRDTARLVSLAILELRMKLHGVADSELRTVCDAMLSDDAALERPQDPKSPHGPRRRSLLKLVK
jgi:hypothetical protein